MEKVGKLDIKSLSNKSITLNRDDLQTPKTSRSARSLPLTECYIDINCDKPSYFPGDTVNALVSMRSKKPIDGDFIQVEVIGKEKAIYQAFQDPESNKDYRHTFLSHK